MLFVVFFGGDEILPSCFCPEMVVINVMPIINQPGCFDGMPHWPMSFFSIGAEAWEALPRLDQPGGLETTFLKFSPVKNTIGTVEKSLPKVY